MKHFLLLITIVFCISNVSSQIIYQQDFSNGKGDMIIIDNDKRMPQEDVIEFAGAWVITDAKSAGDPAAINNSFYTSFSNRNGVPIWERNNFTLHFKTIPFKLALI